MKKLFTLLVLLAPIFITAQIYETVSSGDIESSQVWKNGMVPPFVISKDIVKIPASLELNIFHGLRTSKAEVVNYGIVSIEVNQYADPTIHWRNHGNLELTGWSPNTGRFINEKDGKILFLAGIYCQHTGCGSENYGEIYVNTCLSNICAYDKNSRFINHKDASIFLCKEEGYIENYWRLPNAGSIENLVFINNGNIYYDDTEESAPFYNEGNDFFNGLSNSIGTFTGNELQTASDLECLARLPELSTSTFENEIEANIEIYPNPSSGELAIYSDLDYDYIRVINSLGQIVENISFSDSKKLVAKTNKKGLYIFQFVKNSDIITIRKVIYQ